ncbi:hypothetical protein GCM10009687_68310 [Asanoa iriomotensis]|uniref:Uncharacterized protein n=1 Tax=Asanoa iriomotensis TaxID=234613 RepID=A0ABQ4C5D5_9ACTN|nr:hypothetical protein Air01nite_40640 [Asanoa iriomotensis]
MLAVFASLALLTACAQPSPLVGDGSAFAPAAPGAVSTDWAAFPVDQVPRPIIVASDGMVDLTGFHSGEGKLAFLGGAISLTAPLPEAPATVAVDLPEGRFTFPALPPDDAFASLRAQGSPGNVSGATPAPLRVTSVTLGAAEFNTDRGRVRLPAWLFGGPDIMGTIAWPAVGKEAFWRYGEPNDAATVAPAQLSQEGRRIRWSVPGQDNCPSSPVMRYRVEVTETPTTVLLTTIGEVVSTPGPEDKDRACLAIGIAPEPYDVDLTTPLGNRVVLADSI